jgi:hypothetical protein
MKLNLNQKLSEIQAKLKAKKSRYNGFGKYNYRAAEDILEAIKPFLIEYKVALTINEEMINDDSPIIRTTAELLDVESDDAIHATAIVGVDLMSKGMSMPQKYGAASSYGKKYALGNLLLIDDTADADASNDHSGKKAKVTITSKKDPLYDKAIKFVQGGGDVTAITGKYSVSKEIQKLLTDAIPIATETL